MTRPHSCLTRAPPVHRSCWHWPTSVHARRARVQNMSLNTLRMLRKLAGAELLRQTIQARQPAAARHTLVVRMRPDLLLLGRPELLPHLSWGSRDLWLPWLCHGERLANDQMLVGSPAAMAHLAQLWEPDVMRRCAFEPPRSPKQPAPPHTAGCHRLPSFIRRSDVCAPYCGQALLEATRTAGTMYPERLVYVHLVTAGFSLHERPVRTLLLGADADVARARDPLAKLRRDFPHCSYPSGE